MCEESDLRVDTGLDMYMHRTVPEMQLASALALRRPSPLGLISRPAGKIQNQQPSEAIASRSYRDANFPATQNLHEQQA